MIKLFTKYILTIYIWMFIIFHISPIKYLNSEKVDISPPGPSPFIYPYSYIFGVKTVFNSYIGNPLKLLELAERENVDFIFTDSPSPVWINFGGKNAIKIALEKCTVVGFDNFRFYKKAIYYSFEYIPKSIVGSSPVDIFSFYFPQDVDRCIILSSDMEIVLSMKYLGGIDIPNYKYIIGKRRNMLLSRDIYGDVSDIGEDITKTVVLLDKDIYFWVYGYSEKSFYMPGEIAMYPFRLVIKTDKPNTLIFIYKDGKMFRVLESDGKRIINIPIVREGSYSVGMFSYKFKVWNIYFGIRWLAYAPPIIYNEK